jgi:hypothetical protein
MRPALAERADDPLRSPEAYSDLVVRVGGYSDNLSGSAGMLEVIISSTSMLRLVGGRAPCVCSDPRLHCG